MRTSGRGGFWVWIAIAAVCSAVVLGSVGSFAVSHEPTEAPDDASDSSTAAAPADLNLVGSRIARYQSMTAAAWARKTPRELRPLVRQVAAVTAMADSGSEVIPKPLHVLLMGNLQSYSEPCFCSGDAETGGLTATTALVRWWRRCSPGRTCVVEVGNSLLPLEELPHELRKLHDAKVDLLAEAYREIGVESLAPSANDLRALSGAARAKTWCAAAAVRMLVSNHREEEPPDWVETLHVISDKPRIVLASHVSPSPGTDWLARGGLDLTFDRVQRELASGGFVVLVLHGLDPTNVNLPWTGPAGRRLVVVPVQDTPMRTDLWQQTRRPALARHQVIVPASRGRSFGVLTLAWSPSGTPDRLEPVDFDLLDLEALSRRGQGLQRIRSGRLVRATDQAVLCAARQVAVFPDAAKRIGEPVQVAARIAAYDAEAFQAVLDMPLFDNDEIPQKVRRWLTNACASCHEAQTQGYVAADPHREALASLLTQSKRPPGLGCLVCHVSGLRRANSDAAAGAPSRVLRSRKHLRGVTCLTCHRDVGSEHLATGKGLVDARRANAACTTCHDSVNSPEFKLKKYAKHLGCCQAPTKKRR